MMTREEPRSTVRAANACFDCNICLDFAVEPVVTLCGHLYCWHCIYKWLKLERETEIPNRCPVCKAALSTAALVPLYGRGSSGADKAGGGEGDVPRRPPAHVARRPGGEFSYGHPPLLGGTAVAVLPWVLGDEWVALYHAYPYRLIGGGDRGGDNPRLRRHERLAKTSLHRMSIFFFCCVILCLLLF